MKYYRDIKASLDTKFEEGKNEGIKERSKEIAIKMLKKNTPIEIIIDLTDLSKEEIKNLSKDLHF